jgi:hypothetical protein
MTTAPQTPSRRRLAPLVLLWASLLVSGSILLLPSSPVAAQDAGAPSLDGGAKVWSSCAEYLPKGATRPQLEAHLPTRGLSGYAAPLVVIVTHGPGETVMPGGFRVQRGSDAMRALEESGWVIPEPDGGAGPLIDRPKSTGSEKTVTTTLTLSFVPLPKEPGRHELILPPVPISVGRANGQVMTLCTEPQRIIVDDPIANELDPKVKGNPPPRPQREAWPLAKQATFGVLAAIALAILLAWLLRRVQQRPKIVPPKPKVLPWIAAMKELAEIRGSSLLADDKHDEYFDRVSECTRRYLGDRYGFDGLESTSTEVRLMLKRVYPPLSNLDGIDRFLDNTDFIKYAEVSPSLGDCDDSIDRAEDIVRVTTPPAAVRLEPGKRPSRRAA